MVLGLLFGLIVVLIFAICCYCLSVKLLGCRSRFVLRGYGGCAACVLLGCCLVYWFAESVRCCFGLIVISLLEDAYCVGWLVYMCLGWALRRVWGLCDLVFGLFGYLCWVLHLFVLFVVFEGCG